MYQKSLYELNFHMFYLDEIRTQFQLVEIVYKNEEKEKRKELTILSLSFFV